jgi:Gram-negative bacterial TonB protein C-terminal
MNTAAATATDKMSMSTTNSRPPFTERGALRLFVRRESFFPNLFGCLAAIVRPGPRSRVQTRYFLRGRALPVAYRGRSATLSLVLHGAAIALLVYLPPLLPVEHPVPQTQQPEKIYYYYRIPLQQLPQPPQAVSTSPRQEESSHRAATSPPKLQNPPAHSLAALMSHPAHPDNVRQTIYQSASPPDLIIRTEQKLPNVVILQQNQPSLTAPLLQSYSRPAANEQRASAPQAPAVMEATGPTPVGVIAQIADNSPHLAIPVAGGGAPPTSSASVSEGPPSQAPDVVVVGVDPADATSQLSLPNGNRWGEFSIAPPAQTPGSPSGVEAGSNSNANAKSGTSGTASHGILANAGMRGPVNIPGSGSGGTGILAPALAVSLVFPVVQPALTVRRNSMVISAGPIGGGGLNVYGALNCGKIYSIFLPMPGRNWSLQYCARPAGSNKLTPSPQTAVIHLANPLLPPDVDLQHRYDFKRVAVQGPNANRPIILKGVIGADGTVQQLVVYRGVSALADEAARIAFSRWRFKPAMRDGKPVAVDILVGIPPAAGQDYINR